MMDGSGQTAYFYDAMGQLTNKVVVWTNGPVCSLHYGYDAHGALTNLCCFILTASDWLTNDAYDNNGNTTNSSGNSYQYDALNHATNVNNGGIFIAYDGDGNRVRKTLGSTTTYYLPDDRNPSGYVQVLEEWSAASGATNLNRVYNYGLDLISQRVPGSGTNYFIFDGHGSTRMLVDIGCNVQNAFAHDAFGSLIASNTTSRTAYLYCGQQFHSDLEFYYNRARYLSQNTERFWTMDTDQGDNQDPLSLHRYLYVADNPVDNDDPFGLYTQREGYGVEKLIRDQYAVEHDGQDINQTGGPIGVGINPALRPDIWNKSSDPKTFAEIKPLSLSGIARGITQLNKYEKSLKGLLYVRDN